MDIANRQATVMIVDDVPENLKLLSMILQKEGYNVEIFSNGPDALQAAEQKPPDIILLDISMPEMDGYQVCEKLKSDKQLCRIPVIFVSALSQISEKVKGFKIGGQDYVTKPFQVKEVTQRIKTHLELAWTRRELEKTLSQTLTGTIKLLTDFMAFTNPFVFTRAARIKENMMIFIEQLNLTPARWFELAAVFSQFGPAALPIPLQEKFSTWRKLNPGETEQIDNTVKLLETMLRNIPRLQPVADMIAQHKLTLKMVGNKPFTELTQAEQGGMLLNLLQQYDQLLLAGRTPNEVIETLTNERNFPNTLYNVLRKIARSADGWTTRYCYISELEPHMFLEEDILDVDGRTLLKRGVSFSATIVEALSLQKQRLVKNKVMVRAKPALL